MKHIAGKLQVPLIIAGVLLIIVMAVPFRSTFVLGGDEGMELCKALLYVHEPGRVGDMWNDQPFLYTWALGGFIRVFGTELWPPRLASLAMTGLLLAMMCRLLPRESQWPSYLTCVLIFITWPSIPGLSMSAMCELIAFSVAMCAVGVAVTPEGNFRSIRAAGCGLLLGVAVNIKFTAIIVMPALAATMLFTETRQARHWLVAGGAFVLCSAALALALPHASWDLLWNSHMEARSTAFEKEYSNMGINWTELLDAPGALLAAGVGLVSSLKYKGWSNRSFIFATVLLATSVHISHRPWWWYYNVHLAIPISMLAALGMNYLSRAVRKQRFPLDECDGSRPARVLGQVDGSAALGLLAVVALWVSFGVTLFSREVLLVSPKSARHDDELLSIIGKYAASSKWVFARGPGLVYAFRSGIPMPPELIILSRKRFLAGRIREEDVTALVERYDPEMLLLPKVSETPTMEWQNLLSDRYVFVSEHPWLELYVHKRLHPAKAPSPGGVAASLGL
ncbi:MAG: glycosyltransferase family 39 protein [Verrucomicrobiae bacterium]|nr:glycosyltransferase family 39 protein [Verrucomicrobiae bacterium]